MNIYANSGKYQLGQEQYIFRYGGKPASLPVSYDDPSGTDPSNGSNFPSPYSRSPVSLYHR